MACAHEYTKANLAFAQSIFPHSEAIKKRAQNIDDLLHNEGASVPCLFGLEQETNPFLLALREPYTQELAQKFALLAQDHTAIIAALRRAKDQF
jgi:hydroxyacylglutathione hydrolase